MTVPLPPATLIQGHVYRIHTKASNQRLAREHILTYLGASYVAYMSEWSARPKFGTQTIDIREIVLCEDLGKSEDGASDSRHRMNRVIRNA